MGFFKDMVKSREEWLSKPNILLNYSANLNTNFTSKLFSNSNSTQNSNTEIDRKHEPDRGSISKTK